MVIMGKKTQMMTGKQVDHGDSREEREHDGMREESQDNGGEREATVMVRVHGDSEE